MINLKVKIHLSQDAVLRWVYQIDICVFNLVKNNL